MLPIKKQPLKRAKEIKKMLVVKKEIGDFDELYNNSWNGAIDTLDAISNANLEDEFMQYLEEVFYNEEVGETELNDYLWFNRDNIYDSLGLDENGEIPKEEEAK